MQEKLLHRLHEFISLHHRHQMYRGLVRFAAWSLGVYVAMAVLGYFGSTSSLFRGILLLGWVVVTGVIFYSYMFEPLLAWVRPDKRLSLEQAADLLGKHFPEVADKLLNALQLQEQAKVNALAMAAVEQRLEAYKNTPFQRAVDSSKTKRLLPYLLVPVLPIGLLIALGFGSALFEGPRRIVQYMKPVVLNLPYDLIVPQRLVVSEGDEIPIDVEVVGSSLPDAVELLIRGQRLPMNKTSEEQWTYRLSGLKESQMIQVSTGELSKDVWIEVVAMPAVLRFTARLTYPKHMGLGPKDVDNTGDLTVPEGTRIDWLVLAKHADQLVVQGRDTVSMDAAANGSFVWTEHAMQSASRSWVFVRKGVDGVELTRFQLRVVPDAYPQLRVEEATATGKLNLEGWFTDDYGFHDAFLEFVTTDSTWKMPLPLQEGVRQMLSVSLNWEALGLAPGTKATVQVVVRDNDAPHGYKAAKSQPFTYLSKTIEEREQELEAAQAAAQSSASSMQEEAKRLQKQLEALKKKALSKQAPEWKDKQDLNELLRAHKDLEEKLQKLEQELQEQRQEKQQLGSELSEKEKQLEELMKDLLSPESKKLLEELKRLQEKLDKDQLKETLEKLQLRDKELNRELERNLELMKQIQMEQKVEKMLADLERAQMKQEELLEKDVSKENKEQLVEEQLQLKKDVDQLQKDFQEMKQENKDLDQQWDLPQEMDELQEAGEQMEKSAEEMQQGEMRMSKQQQQNAKEKLEEAEEKLQSMMSGMSANQAQANLDDVRKLLNNLMGLSAQQEQTMLSLSALKPDDPAVRGIMERQRQIRDASAIVQDSLQALALRAPQVKPVIGRKLDELQSNQRRSLDELTERNVQAAGSRMRSMMTTFNDLSLLLAEAMDQMQQAMANQMKGEQSCQKPGGGKPSMANMRKMQQALSQQMKEMQQKPGNMPGKGRPSQSMSKELAEMMAKQEALRQQLMDLMEGMNDGGSQGTKGNLQKAIEEMKENEKQLAKGRITDELINRQKDLDMRLLEAENAERERDEKEERESEQPGTPPAIRIKSWEELKRENRFELQEEMKQRVRLTPFYEEKNNQIIQGRGN